MDAADATLMLGEHSLARRGFGSHALGVEGDEVGLPPGLGPAATGAPGLRLLHSPTGQLEGRVESLRLEWGAGLRVAFRELLHQERA